VVIGIISVLISILLPTLGKAREAARTAQCLSNIRQFGMSLQMYANEYKDCVPLAHVGGSWWQGYSVWIGMTTTGDRGPLYPLYERGYFKQPQSLFCPSQYDTRYTFDHSDNPWPPPPDRQQGPAGGHIRTGYTTRPEVSFTKNAAGPFYTPAVNNNDPINSRGKWPHLAKFKNKAILVEAIGIPTTSSGLAPILVPHKKQVVVFYGDRSGRAVQLKPIEQDLINIRNGGSSPPFQFYLDESSSQAPRGFWLTLDRL
jgi:type II secretory pathway pseudopilin PulG